MHTDARVVGADLRASILQMQALKKQRCEIIPRLSGNIFLNRSENL
jgi:hypothetical protein